jgi:hypothetical protein
MIKVAGAVAEIVPLPDLNDRVFYKQEKTFSEAQYHKSFDLQREIQRGRLRVLARTSEKFSEYKTPDSVDIPEAPGATGTHPSVDVHALITHIQNLEMKISEQQAQPGPTPAEATESPLILKLLEKIEALEGRLSHTTQADNGELLEAMKRLEGRVTSSESTNIMKKLEDLVTRAPTMTGTVQKDNRTIKEIEQDIYIPNIKIEDGSSHIKLKTRTVEKSSSVDAAAEALKRLRQGKS